MSEKATPKLSKLSKKNIMEKRKKLNHIDEPVIKNSYEEKQFGDYIVETEQDQREQLEFQEQLRQIEQMEDEQKKEKKEEKKYRPLFYISSEQWTYLDSVKDMSIVKKAISILAEETIKHEEGLCQYPTIEYAVTIAMDIIQQEKKEKKEEQEKKEKKEKQEKQKEMNAKDKQEYSKEDLLKIRNKFLDKIDNL